MEYFAVIWAKGEKQIPCGDDNKKTRAKTKTKTKAKAKRLRDAQPHLSYLLTLVWQIEWN
jgi:hypothetical protein